jgi:hypothetical protein
MKGLPIALLIMAVIGLTYYMMIFAGLHSYTDFRLHHGYAINCINGRGCKVIAYPAYHIVLIAVRSFVSFDRNNYFSEFITISAFQVASTLIILHLLTSSTEYGRSVLASMAKVFLAFALIIVAPINLPTWRADLHYLSYISPNSFHNPTIIALKPFALLAAWNVAALLSLPQVASRKIRYRATLNATLSTLLSAVAKPVYAICLLPVLLLHTVQSALHRARRKLLIPLLICIISLTLILILQYYLLFSERLPTNGGKGISFSPFLVMNYYVLGYESADIEYGQILLRLLASIAFPGAVTILFKCAAFKSYFLRVSLLAFLVGAFYTYFLAEGNFKAGNFGWSGEISLFVWFAAATVLLYGETISAIGKYGWRIWTQYYFCWVLFIFHLYCGIVFVRCGGCW